MIYPTKKLTEVCIFEGGTQPPKSTFIYEPRSDYIRLLQIRDFKSDKNATYIPDEDRLKKCKDDDIMIGRYGASVGQILRGKSGAYNVALIKATPNEKILLRQYLFYFLNSRDMQIWFKSRARSAQAGFNQTELSRIEIPLPPLSEQKKIVMKLEKLLTKVNEARRLRTEAQETTSQLLSAELYKIFEEGKRKGWKEKNIGDPSIMKITSGGTPSKSHPEYYGGTIKWLKSGELNDDVNISDSEDCITEEAIEKSSAKIFPKHTVLLAMYGATAGKLGILGVEASTNQAVAGMICKKETLDYKYLYYALANIRNHIIAKAWGGAQPNLSQTIIKNFKIPLPSLLEQKKIVARLDSITEKSKQIQEYQKFTSNDLLALEQSILSKAFSCKFV